MQYLLLTIVSSVLVASFIKLSEKNDCNRIAVAAVNYLFALLFSIALAVFQGEIALSMPTLLVGVYGGITWVMGLLLLMYAVKRIGVAITSSVARLSVVLPVLLSVILYSEAPGKIRSFGILLAIAAIFLLSLRAKRDGRTFEPMYVAVLLFVWFASGSAEFAGKLFAAHCPAEEKSTYLCVLFTTALMITSLAAVLFKKKPTRRDILFGGLIGLPNALSGLFIVSALVALDAVLVYPTVAVGTVVIVSALGIAVWKEKIPTAGYVGIALAIVSLILVNMR